MELSEIPGLRRDKFGRLLAPSRVNARSEIVVASPAGEQLSVERLRALGVDMAASPRGPGAINKPSDGGGQDSEDGQRGEFPQHAGGGYYDLSDGSRVQGEEAARQAQAELDRG